MSAAIAKRAKTRVATTPFVPNAAFCSSSESKACFIQMNVAPQTKVTASKAKIAIFLCLSVLSSISDD